MSGRDEQVRASSTWRRGERESLTSIPAWVVDAAHEERTEAMKAPDGGRGVVDMPSEVEVVRGRKASC